MMVKKCLGSNSTPAFLTESVGLTHLSNIYFFIVFSDTAPQRWLLPPRPRGFLITHNDAPRSVGLLWTSDQLVAETSA
jgi:hypothetical protein